MLNITSFITLSVSHKNIFRSICILLLVLLGILLSLTTTGGLLWKKLFQIFRKIYRKASVLESFLIKIVGFTPSALFKKWLRYRRFLMNFLVFFFRIAVLHNTRERLVLLTTVAITFWAPTWRRTNVQIFDTRPDKFDLEAVVPTCSSK